MDRRSFLKTLLVGAGALLIDKTALAANQKTDTESTTIGLVGFDEAIRRAYFEQRRFLTLEINDDITRHRMTAALVDVADVYRRTRRIYDYRVVCDETNNTSEIVDAGHIVVDVFYKERAGIDFKHINIGPETSRSRI